MPTALLTISEKFLYEPTIHGDMIRRAVAKGMLCDEMPMDETHISLRTAVGYRRHMLADLEIEVFAQLFESRAANRDMRANTIARAVSDAIAVECACWVNLNVVGYSRIAVTGEEFFSAGPRY